MMAVSFKIVIVLVALAAFSLGYIALDKPVDNTISTQTEDRLDSEAGTTGYQRFTEAWSLLPVIATIAGISYLLKESVFQSGRY
jgi:hypothetical protein